MGDALVGLLFFWALCGVLAAVIANQRNGSAALGCVIGVLLGPIGILIACFIGSPTSPPPRTQDEGPRKRCPDCAEWVLPEARVCRHCRHEFQAAPTTPGNGPN